MAAFFIMFFGIGIFRYEVKNIRNIDENLSSQVQRNITVFGYVINEPIGNENTIQFVFSVDRISSSTTNGTILIFVRNDQKLNYGDYVSVTGKLEMPKNFSTNASSSREFDYINYLAKDAIYYRMNGKNIKIISHDNLNSMKLFLISIKKSFEGKIDSLIPKKEAGLLNGILLGDKSEISKETMQQFQVSGIPHIVVLSGYNITIVANTILKGLSCMPKMYGQMGGIFGIIIFVFMTGATSTSVRAAIMAILAILAGMHYRNYKIGRALIVTGLIMVFINPKILVFDISFQLSFLATVAIIYLSPVMKEKIPFITDRWGIRDIISSTISAQIFVLPLILYKMGLLSFVSLFTNFLILPFIPATMFFGFLTGVFGYFFAPMAILFSWITDIFLMYIMHISKFFAGIPFSHIMIDYFPVWFMVFCYALITYWTIQENIKLRNTKSAGV